MADEVVEELWRIKDAIAREHGYDIPRLAAELQIRQRETGRRVVNLQASRQPGSGHLPAEGGS